jgi:death-on-curing protein
MIFLRTDEVIAIHREVIERFGGSHGLRDRGLLESALAAAENRYLYENISVAIAGATYAFHLAKAHAFVDGNKRIAAAASEIFIMSNGQRLQATNDQIVKLILGIASGLLSRSDAEEFYESHTAAQR